MTSIVVKSREIAWLRGPSFDLWFIAGIAVVAIASGIAVTLEPALFPVILFLDLWLLGYHHVISTFTRILLDRESFAQYWFLVTVLPIIVIAGVVAMAQTLGFWSVATLYLYWQWFHYSRQSYGIAQAYRRKSNGLVTDDPVVFQIVFYLIPLWGILHRSADDPTRFLMLPVKALPVAPVVADAVGALAIAALVWWVARVARLAWNRKLPVAHTLFMVSHFAIFITGYVLIDHIDRGWLVLNVWHNAQYIMFVWHYNNARFKDRIDPQHRLLSTLSQRRNVVLYLALCLVATSLFYALIRETVVAVATNAYVTVVLAYQVLNFHHYVVDAVIWRSRRKGGAPPAAEPRAA
ncbi:MAG TPA: hypothetical protein VMM18_07430 [Gemmatimonadaceae bacterium]|nr:hypothetical protein [Gemmatimonadaceae bacterium]